MLESWRKMCPAAPGLAAGLLAGLLMLAPAARAEVISSPARAVQLLAQARAMAAKCGWLDARARNELAAFARQARKAATRREGERTARRAAKKGRALGAKAACNAENREMVMAVLEGARAAMREAKGTARKAPKAAMKAKAAQKRRPAPRRADAAKAKGAKGARKASGVSLARYRRMASAYYHALKCRNRPHGELMRMWRKVRDAHMALLRQEGGAAVARAKAAAARKGRAKSCRKG